MVKLTNTNLKVLFLKKYNYCTLFDSNYLTRGLAMYESLKKNSDDFHLYIFPFDDRSLNLLKKLDLESVTIISLKEFEDNDLLKVKNDRTKTEYCWTCTPSIIKYCIEKYQLYNCTYLDADLYFFSKPSVLIEEMGNKSVLITEHRYTKEYDQSATSGIYCVQFMTFINDANSMKVLDLWRNACNKWCYARFENGKFGDQKYLDNWTKQFVGIHELKHLGGGVAPWNIQQYKLEKKPFELIFYHFHSFKYLPNDKVDLGNYKLRKTDLLMLYKPYLLHLEKIKIEILNVDDSYDYHGTSKLETDWKKPLRNLNRRIKQCYNIYNINYILGL